MKVSEAVRTFAGLAVPEAGAAEFLRPAAEHDELKARRLRKQIDEERRELREALAAFPETERALAATREPLERALAAIDGVEPALARVRVAHEADADARRATLEHGRPHDSARTVAVETALRDAREAERAQTAARDVLPVLQKRVEDAEARVRKAQSRIDEAISRVLLATLAQRVQDAHAAAARLHECYEELASVDALLMYSRASGMSSMLVPEEFVPPPVAMIFDAEELQPAMRPWRDYAARLAEDPESQFESR